MTSPVERVPPTRWAWCGLALASATLAGLLTAVVRRERLLPGEVGVTRWLHDGTPGPLRAVASVLDVGFTEYAAPAVFVLLVGLAWWRWGHRTALVLLFAGSLTGLTKLTDLAVRPRPTEDLRWTAVVAGEGGFPSGHVVYAVVVFGMLAHLVARREPPGRARTGLVAVLVGLVVASGPARLVVLDHWPADVLAGYLIGFPLLAAAIWVERRAHLVAAARPLRSGLSSAGGP